MRMKIDENCTVHEWLFLNKTEPLSSLALIWKNVAHEIKY